MKALRSSLAVDAGRHREQQRRRHQVRNLQPDMVVTLAEQWCLDESGQSISPGLVLLREHRMGDPHILSMVSSIAYDEATGVLLSEEVVKIPGDVLNGIRVGGVRLKRLRRLLDPYAPDEPDVVMFDEAHNAIEHPERVPTLPLAPDTYSLPQFRSLDLRKYVVEMPRHLAWVEPSLESKEIRRERPDRRGLHNQPGEDHERRRSGTGVRSFEPAGLVDVTDVHGSERNYGRPKATVGRGVRPRAYAPM